MAYQGIRGTFQYILINVISYKLTTNFDLNPTDGTAWAELWNGLILDFYCIIYRYIATNNKQSNNIVSQYKLNMFLTY